MKTNLSNQSGIKYERLKEIVESVTGQKVERMTLSPELDSIRSEMILSGGYIRVAYPKEMITSEDASVWDFIKKDVHKLWELALARQAATTDGHG